MAKASLTTQRLLTIGRAAHEHFHIFMDRMNETWLKVIIAGAVQPERNRTPLADQPC
jgi:hypothetical protein